MAVVMKQPPLELLPELLEPPELVELPALQVPPELPLELLELPLLPLEEPQ